MEKEVEMEREMSKIMAYKVEDFDFYLKVSLCLIFTKYMMHVIRKKIWNILKHHLIFLTKMIAAR